MSNIKSIVIIGTGNLAWHLAHLFKKHNLEVAQIYGRNENAAAALAKEILCDYTSDIKQINQSADLYLIALTDHAISNLAAQLKLKKTAIVAHTAGSVDLDTLKFTSENFGIFYPLQTFTKNTPIDFKATPFFIEANNEATHEKLIQLANVFSNHVHSITSADRLKLHLAAVLTSNFMNHLNTLTYDYLKNQDLEKLYPTLLPLLQTSIEKLKTQTPQQSQTGPAKRNDQSTIDKHLHLLIEDDELRKVYEMLSQSISNYYR